MNTEPLPSESPKVVFGVTVASTALLFLKRQIERLVDEGWEVHLVCSEDCEALALKDLRDIYGLRVHTIKMAREPKILGDVGSFLSWLLVLRRLHPDIVVAGTPKAGLLGTLAARLLCIPIRVYHVRGYRAETLSGIPAAISRASERVSLWASTHSLFNSQSNIDVMHRDGLLAASRGVVLGRGSSHGVDTQHFRQASPLERRHAREKLGLSDSEVVIGFVGRLTRDKGIQDLIRAAQLIVLTQSRVRLVLFGPLEDRGVEDLLIELEPQQWLSYHGWTRDTREAYWSMDIFCLPSRREGFPNVNLEAQACGLPVVTTRATGCEDSIQDGRSGILVSPGNVPELAEALQSLIRDEQRTNEMKQHARKYVTSNYDEKVVTELHVKYLSGLITQR